MESEKKSTIPTYRLFILYAVQNDPTPYEMVIIVV